MKMSDIQDFIAAKTREAVNDFISGVATKMFPLEKESGEDGETAFYYIMKNVMAYGYEHGMELGYELAHAQMKDGTQTPHLDKLLAQLDRKRLVERYSKLSEEKKKSVHFLLQSLIELDQGGEAKDGGAA